MSQRIASQRRPLARIMPGTPYRRSERASCSIEHMKSNACASTSREESTTTGDRASIRAGARVQDRSAVIATTQSTQRCAPTRHAPLLNASHRSSKRSHLATSSIRRGMRAHRPPAKSARRSATARRRRAEEAHQSPATRVGARAPRRSLRRIHAALHAAATRITPQHIASRQRTPASISPCRTHDATCVRIHLLRDERMPCGTSDVPASHG